MSAAMQASYENGIVSAVAAGNAAGDACLQSPADSPFAITVGATDQLDELAYFSDRGACVDMLAPGTDITSSYMGSSVFTYATLSGTSQATPFVHRPRRPSPGFLG